MYSREQLVCFSIIYSSLIGGKYKNPIIGYDTLFEFYNMSLSRSINVFESTNLEVEKLIDITLKKMKEKNSRLKIETRMKKLKELFLNENKILKLLEESKKEIDRCNLKEIEIIDYFSDNYPKLLKELNDSPFVLYLKGKLPSEEELKKSLAVVGSRKMSKNYGEGVALRVGKTLGELGWWNISGLALGADTFGHIGSLKASGKTGAILGYGLGVEIFPKENNDLAQEILDKGGFLLSELPSMTKSESLFFTQRNRLQSGMARGIFVVETSNNSGTMHTVKYSLEQNKLSYVWDPRMIEEHKEIKEFNGNLNLISYKDHKQIKNVKINKEYLYDIISVISSDDLVKKLNNL